MNPVPQTPPDIAAAARRYTAELAAADDALDVAYMEYRAAVDSAWSEYRTAREAAEARYRTAQENARTAEDEARAKYRAVKAAVRAVEAEVDAEEARARGFIHAAADYHPAAERDMIAWRAAR